MGDYRLTTQLYSGDWIEAVKDHLSDAEIDALRKMPSTQLLSESILREALGIKRSKKLLKICSIHPEINADGLRRCTYEKDGIRCTRYAEIPVCDKHFEEVSMFHTQFRSVALKEQYMKLLNSKQKMHLDGELALMRLMLGLLVKQIGDGNVHMEQVVGVTAMCDKISGVVDKMHKMTAITPETIEKLMDGVTDIIAKYVPADKLDAAASEIAMLQPKTHTCDIPFEPGDELVLPNGEVKEVEVIPLQKRMLLEVAATIGATPNE